MLLTIHVKNFALIDDAQITLGEGLNILTGETGAGKSILIDAVNVCLGAKASKEMIRNRAEYALVELVFSVNEPDRVEELKKMDIFVEEDGILIVSRRIMSNRSICKINDETVTVGKIRQVTGFLIDIHGQHEHQSLLYKAKHLEILDAFCHYQIEELKKELEQEYKIYAGLSARLEEFNIDEEQRIREMDFLRFEIQEIEQVGMKDGEEEELAVILKKMANSRKIAEALKSTLEQAGYESGEGAGERIGRAVREMTAVQEYDEKLSKMAGQLETVEDLLSGFCRDISDYMESLVYDGELMRETESRLDLIRSIQAKYGADYQTVMENLEKKKSHLEELEQFAERKEQTVQALGEAEKKVMQLADKLSAIRKAEAFHLTESIRIGLVDLNFLDVRFSMDFQKKEQITKNGYDEMEFLISTNPGEELKPLGQVASGGELSRIMLAIKAVLADTDDIETLIFDEIDTGISGRTAQKVSEKLCYIAKNHQVICITHLAQIAAMADNHFCIRKQVRNGVTVTKVEALQKEEQITELARILGGAKITDTVLESAKEMKTLAFQYKVGR